MTIEGVGAARRELAALLDAAVWVQLDFRERIAAFASGTSEWLVAVRMVSEGVDIPRLRVGVYATATTTDLFFRQTLGRFVRWEAEVRNQRAWLYVPDDFRLRAPGRRSSQSSGDTHSGGMPVGCMAGLTDGPFTKDCGRAHE